MRTYQRGNLTESIILEAYTRAGFLVALPFGSGGSYDLIVDTGLRLLKIQAKTGWISKGCICYTSRRKAGSTFRALRKYTDSEADFFAIYCPANDELYAVPAANHISQGRLRLEVTKNKQQAIVRWAEDYSWDNHVELLKRM